MHSVSDIAPATRRITLPEDLKLDPFEFNLPLRPLSGVPTRLLIPFFVALLVAVVVATFVDGTTGSLAQFQLVEDLRRVARLDTPGSAPEFPLIRDVATWLLLIIVVVGGLGLHQQWRLMARALDGLTRNGALVAVSSQLELAAGRDRLSRLLGIDGILTTAQPSQALGALVTKVMTPLRKWRYVWSAGTVALTFLLLSLLINGEKHGLFQAFAPSGLSPDAKRDWWQQAYDNWWAGDQHLAGHVVYWIAGVVGLYVIVAYNTVGIVVVYFVLCLRYVTRNGADWTNADGNYGWKPLGEVYRTVVIATGILGLALTVILALLGLDNAWWIGGILLIYLIAVPGFVLLPRMVFASVDRRAREERVEGIRKELGRLRIDVDTDYARASPYLAEIERVQRIRIRPLQVRQTSIVSLALPVILGVAQIVFPNGFF